MENAPLLLRRPLDGAPQLAKPPRTKGPHKPAVLIDDEGEPLFLGSWQLWSCSNNCEVGL
jgi:hypothetical protein